MPKHVAGQDLGCIFLGGDKLLQGLQEWQAAVVHCSLVTWRTADVGRHTISTIWVSGELVAALIGHGMGG